MRMVCTLVCYSWVVIRGLARWWFGYRVVWLAWYRLRRFLVYWVCTKCEVVGVWQGRQIWFTLWSWFLRRNYLRPFITLGFLFLSVIKLIPSLVQLLDSSENIKRTGITATPKRKLKSQVQPRIIKKLTKPTDNSNSAARRDALWPSRSLQSRLADRLLSKTHFPGPDVVGPDFKIRRSLFYSSAQKILQLTALHDSNSLLLKNDWNFDDLDSMKKETFLI